MQVVREVVTEGGGECASKGRGAVRDVWVENKKSKGGCKQRECTRESVILLTPDVKVLLRRNFV